MEERMQEPYAEGLATRGDPEPCDGFREEDGEASAGAHAGRVLSREINWSRVPTLFRQTEGNMTERERCERTVDPARSETPDMRETSMRENRESHWPPEEMVLGTRGEG
jgi:hypothetical protein